MIRSGLLAILIIVSVGLMCLQAEDDKKRETKSEKKTETKVEKKTEAKTDGKEESGEVQTIESKPTESVSAVTIDFRGVLGLSFDTLATLGVRIEQARSGGDPIGLALAANELAVAEKISGKTAPETADKLTAEAVEWGKLRDDSQELSALALLTTGDTAKELTALAAKAKKRQSEEIAAAKSGEKTRGIYRQLVVTSEAEVPVRIFVNGQFVGSIRPFGHEHFPVHEHGRVVLDARGRHGHQWHEHVRGNFSTYNWTLHD